MIYFWLILKNSLEDFRKNKLRTLLTSLGIFIGVLSVVLLMALGVGLRSYIEQQFESLGTNTIYVMPGNMISGGNFQRSGLPETRFDDKQLTKLKKISNVKHAVPFFSSVKKIVGDKDSGNYEIAASTEEMFQTLNLEIEIGEKYTKSQAEKGSKVAVLGPKVAEKLFGSVESSLHKSILIQDQNFQVIGVTKAKGGGGMGMPSIDDHIYMPFKSASSFNPSKKYFAIYLKADDKEHIPDIIADAKKILLKDYKEDDFSVVEQTEILGAINSIFTIFNSILVAIAAISLVVGGVGIMNIMFVSVIERIREIGIRRAIGARKKDILIQFLTEATLLSILGGILALIVAEIIVLSIQGFIPAKIELTTIIISLSVSSFVGISFGVIPAKKAADLSPIEAIRYE